MLAAFLSVSTVTVLLMRSNNSDSCNTNHFTVAQDNQIRSPVQLTNAASSPLIFMKSKLVLMVSHELSLSGALLHTHIDFRFLFFIFKKNSVWWESNMDWTHLQAGLCCWWSWRFCWEALVLTLFGFLIRNLRNMIGSFTAWKVRCWTEECRWFTLQSSLFIVIWVTVVYAVCMVSWFSIYDICVLREEIHVMWCQHHVIELKVDKGSAIKNHCVICWIRL